MPKLGIPEDYQMLLSFVYKQGMYWLYHSRSLYKPSGEIDDKYNHFEQAWLIIRLMNQKTARKLNKPEEIQDRTIRQKEESDYIKVEQGDVMKFGRVRFRVKNLVTEMMHNDEANLDPRSANLTQKGKTGPQFGVNSTLNKVGAQPTLNT